MEAMTKLADPPNVAGNDSFCNCLRKQCVSITPRVDSTLHFVIFKLFSYKWILQE